MITLNLKKNMLHLCFNHKKIEIKNILFIIKR